MLDKRPVRGICEGFEGSPGDHRGKAFRAGRRSFVKGAASDNGGHADHAFTTGEDIGHIGDPVIRMHRNQRPVERDQHLLTQIPGSDTISLLSLSSAGFGHHIGKSIGMGYVRNPDGVDRDYIVSGAYELEVATERVPCEAHLVPLHDPGMAGVKC